MGNNGPKTAFNFVQLVGDIVLVNAGIIIAFLIRFQGESARIQLPALPDHGPPLYLRAGGSAF